MNKIIIPTILAATVLIAGVFAFLPAGQVTTVHPEVSQNAAGASVTVSDSVTSTNLDETTVYHHFVLTSDEPFTLHDIEVKGQITGPDCSSNLIETGADNFPEEYGTNATQALIDKGQSLSNSDTNTVVDGNDDKNPQTWSLRADDGDDSVGRQTFTEFTNLVVQTRFIESCDGTADFTAMVTFFLRGVTETDVEITTFEDTTQLSGTSLILIIDEEEDLEEEGSD